MTAVPPLTFVPAPEEVVLLLLQPAATSASATAPAPTPMVIRRGSRNLVVLRFLCSCGAGPMAAAPSTQGAARRTIAPACSDQIRRPVDRDPPMGQRGQREPTAPAGRNVRPHPCPVLPAAAIRIAPAALLTTTITM